MSLPMRLSFALAAVVTLPLLALPDQQGQNAVPAPSEYELERMVGNQPETPIRVTEWKAPEPQQTNLFLYRVAQASLDEGLMRRVAERFALQGRIEPIRGETLGHIGFEIREVGATNATKVRRVYCWLTMNKFGYSTSDDGYRYNPTTKTHEESNVPDNDAAKMKALELLPLLGISTNDLEHLPNGRLKWLTRASTVSFTDKSTKQRKTVPIMRTVSLVQRVPGGGTTTSIGGGGQVSFGFVSEGRVADIEWCFRKMSRAGQAKPKSSKEVIRDIQQGRAWTWHQNIPTSVTVTDCVLAYPQGNSWLQQEYVWPFYMLTATGSDGRTVTLYVSLEW